MTKIFVGNFSFSVDDEQLRNYFAKVGNVLSAKVMKEGHGGRSRGFGFVEFSGQEEAEQAIRQLDGSVWEGRVIKVSEDRSTRRGDHDSAGGGDRSNSEGGGHSGGGDRGGDRGGYGGGGHSGGGRGGDGGGDYGDRNRRDQSPTGYFRAQPLELGYRRRKKVDPFVEDANLVVDYKDAKLLMRFMSERGRVLPRRMTGLSAYNQRQVTRAIKRAQHVALLPFRR